MAEIRVNPTRMELTRLKKKLAVARRGHRLLKDKRDELMRQFLELVRENRSLRDEVEQSLMQAYGNFLIASALMSSEALEEALMYPSKKVSLEVTQKNIMSVDVPQFQFHNEIENTSIYPYGTAFTSGELDRAVRVLSDVFDKLLLLAEREKTVELLADEIEKTRRRVNALEYVMIPDLTVAIKSITMKLDENERGNLTRLMKVKDMMIAEQLQKSQS